MDWGRDGSGLVREECGEEETGDEALRQRPEDSVSPRVGWGQSGVSKYILSES